MERRTKFFYEEISHMYVAQSQPLRSNRANRQNKGEECLFRFSFPFLTFVADKDFRFIMTDRQIARRPTAECVYLWETEKNNTSSCDS